MGISRDSRHKRRASGGARVIHQKKRKYELGRPAAKTKLGVKRVHTVRTRGGNTKFRALRVDSGAFTWSSEQLSVKTKIMNIVYNATSNEFVRTNTITKGAVVYVDASPFKNLLISRYGLDFGKTADQSEKISKLTEQKRASRAENVELDNSITDQIRSGRILAIITTRPGQVGVANGYILEGEELDFYKKKLDKKRKH
uniref:40S ribosomal protein S8 n=1 Tax=Dermatophagoides pteronyssinus TaxID=6956 RepID=A0A6P6Y4Y4_DERPT|nr:40S ribosomal protein S8-like [Dermatophagoides pteronyssinus]